MARVALSESQNLFAWSQDPTHWFAAGFTATANALLAPDGTMTGTLCTAAVDVSPNVHLTQFVTSSPVGIYTMSVSFHAITQNFVALVPDGANGAAGYFNIANGALLTGFNSLLLGAGVIPEANGWFRCWVTFYRSIAGSNDRFYMASSNGSFVFQGTGTESIGASRIQVVRGTSPGSYTPTNGSAITNPIRSQLFNQQNLLTNSNRPDLAPWTLGTGITSTPNTADTLDPFGGSAANKIVYGGSGSSGGFRVAQNIGIYPALTTAQTFWGRVLSGTRNMRLTNNISTIIVPLVLTTSWQQFTITQAPGLSGTLQWALYDDVGNNSAGTFYIYGMQTTSANQLGVTPLITTAPITNPIRNLASGRAAVSGRYPLAGAPNQFSGLQLWLRSDLGITLNGSTVSKWADQSGNGNDAIQNTALNQPAYATNQVNGLPTLNSDGVNVFMTGTLANTFINCTIFVVDKITADTSGIISISATGASNSGVQIQQASGILRLDRVVTENSVSNSLPTAFQYFVATATNSFGSLTINNGTISTTSAAGAIPTLSQYVLFSLDQGFYRSTAQIGEYIVFNRVLSTQEISSIQNYLHNRYNI